MADKQTNMGPEVVSMEEIKKIIARQKQLYAEVQTVGKNHKKQGREKKTTAYYGKRIEHLEKLEAEIKGNDDFLKGIPEELQTMDYFEKGYGAELNDLVEKHLSVVTKELEEIQNQIDRSSINDIATNVREVEGQNGLSVQGTTQNASLRSIRRQRVMISSLQRALGFSEAEDGNFTNCTMIQKLWDEIESLHFTIWENTDDPVELGYEMDTYTDVEARVMKWLKASSSSKSKPIASSCAPIPLPKIDIPKFDGDYAKWPTFHDLFKTVVHEQKISAVQKMWFLKTNLTGEAERLIRHLSLTEDNYNTAWNMLQDRFNNERVFAATILQQILNYPNVSSEATSLKGFHDIIQESLAALQNAKISTDNWDPLLLQIVVKKLDRHTHVLYESSLADPKKIQKVDHFLRFLEQRFQALESLGPKDKIKQVPSHMSTKAASAAVAFISCKVCDAKDHAIYYCKKFLDMTPKKRYQWAQSSNLCINCLQPGHGAKSCTSRACKHCNKRHNSLLHFEANQRVPNDSSGLEHGPGASTSASAIIPIQHQSDSNSEPSDLYSPSVLTTNIAGSAVDTSQGYVLLATVKVKIVANNGQTCEARAVLDAGSQVNLITQRLINKLSLSTTKAKLVIEGVGQQTGNSTARVNTELHAATGEFSTRFEAFVIPQIISPQPSQNLDIAGWNIPKRIELADPNFHTSGKIDILIGAEHYHHLLRPEQIKLGNHLPMLQNSVLGWFVIGRTNSKPTVAAKCAIFATEEEKVSDLIERFWKIEELNHQKEDLTPKNVVCETHFRRTVTRNQEGRFIVRLPFAENPSTLGYSQRQAERRFQSLERRLKGDPNLHAEYSKFMHEYEALGHMQRISTRNIPARHYFIPHHCVLKPDSSTTKLRVVFDASAVTSTGLSLNNILHKGPRVQSELFSILLRFRLHKYVFTADIEKMYRQILIHEDDSAYQLIAWRNSDAEDLQYFRLKTVTYGTSSAPYLATKCLQYLAEQNTSKYPLGSAVVHDDFYVDDCLSGADDIATAQEKQRPTTALLKDAGFNLRKWCSNTNRLLSDIPVEDHEINLDLEQSSKQTVKTLGLIWRPKSDDLCGRSHIPAVTTITKRTVLSDLARVFDPLGLFGPVVVKAKIFMQQLWELRVDWDDDLPMPLQQQWAQFREDLKCLNNSKACRHVFGGHTPNKIQLHTFVDASEKAFGAAVYIRSVNRDKTVSVQLLCAKSRIAPLKKLTIPRLELCAAVLGAELTKRVQMDLNLPEVSTYLWSDSTIVLSWIQSPSATLHTFVSNRISNIQQITTAEQWRHVSSTDNPADVLSRGINPDKLNSDSPWFYGPFFLYGSKEWWLEASGKFAELPNDIERRQQRVVAITHEQHGMEALIYRIDHRNSFRFLQNVVAYLRRPFARTKSQHLALSPIELQQALQLIVKTVQAAEFAQELRDLSNHKAVAHSSQLSSLAPFIDHDGMLRVGGRLDSSSLPYDSKHPMVLPYNDPIVKLLFKLKHEENKHCGSQSLLAAMRQRFWPIKGKITARNVVHSCILRSKAKPKLMDQIMGNLPTDRVTMARPFLNTGVDYCGPFAIHHRVRGKKPTKAYLAVFCCFATKAVHLELVTDLTTAAFLGALHRFVGRRGLCKTIYCDNATNFVGARNQLEKSHDDLFSKPNQEKIISDKSRRGINFKFIPPRGPHFGGLWEAAVKSAKYLLLRDVTSANLTYEELETVIVGIEAILNSRPLTPMSSDPNDFSALTPGHFLIGEPLTSVPDQNKDDVSVNAVQRWELVAKLKYDFWERWSSEYLNELQCRHKWKVERENVKEHDMVIIKEDNVPVMNWPIGVIAKVYKGKDGLVRAVDVKTSKGVFNRPLHRLAPLPTAAALNAQDDQGQPGDTTNPTPPSRRALTTDRHEDTTLQPTTQHVPQKRRRTGQEP